MDKKMKKLLFIATIYRPGEKVYPILPRLAEFCDVDVYLFNQMSPTMEWQGNIDIREKFYRSARQHANEVIVGPTYHKVHREHRTSGFKNLINKQINFSKYDLVFIDDNVSKPAWGTPLLYKKAKNAGVLVVAQPHGNREFNLYVSRYIFKSFDMSFVFGPKEVRKFNSGKMKGRIFGGGIPANDKLKDYKRGNKYILVIPNHTSVPKSRTGYLRFTSESFAQCGALQLSQKLGCPIVVKMKTRPSCMKDKRRFESDLGTLAGRGVKILLDVDDDNELIMNAACVISSPSTLAFKSIQAGIPTAVLNKQGMIGNFADYPGLVPCKPKLVLKTIINQTKIGRLTDWIVDNLDGGIDYSSTDIYLKKLRWLLYNRNVSLNI